MKKSILALLTLLLVGYSLPRQDVKMRITTLPSGAVLCESAESEPFEKMGLQVVVRYGEMVPNIDCAQLRAVEKTIYETLQRELPGQFELQPFQLSPNNEPIFTIHMEKRKPQRMANVIREAIDHLNDAIRRHQKGKVGDYFAAKNINLYFFGGFRKPLPNSPFTHFLAQERAIRLINVGGENGYIAVGNQVIARPKSFELADRLEEVVLEKGAEGVSVGVPIEDPMRSETLQELFACEKRLQEWGFVRGDDQGSTLCSAIDAYYALPLTERQEREITTIVHAMGRDSIGKLLWKKKDLERMGRHIDNVHPLRFLGFIFKRPDLAEDVRTFRHSFFTWNQFIGGCKRKLILNNRTNNLKKYVPGFCHELGIDQKVIMHKINERDWDGLVDSLL